MRERWLERSWIICGLQDPNWLKQPATVACQPAWTPLGKATGERSQWLATARQYHKNKGISMVYLYISLYIYMVYTRFSKISRVSHEKMRRLAAFNEQSVDPSVRRLGHSLMWLPSRNLESWTCLKIEETQISCYKSTICSIAMLNYQWVTIPTHMLHVQNIYQHLPHKSPKCR